MLHLHLTNASGGILPFAFERKNNVKFGEKVIFNNFEKKTTYEENLKSRIYNKTCITHVEFSKHLPSFVVVPVILCQTSAAQR